MAATHRPERIGAAHSAQQVGQAYNTLIDYVQNNNGLALPYLKVTGDLTAGGQVVASGNITSGANISAANDIAATRDISAGRDLAVTRNATVGGTLGVTGAITGGADITAGGNLAFKSGTANLLTLDHALTTSPRVIAFPNTLVDDTLVLQAFAQTLTNKTYSGGVLAGTFTVTPPLVITNTVAPVLTFNTTAAAAVNGLVALARAGAFKGALGLDALDQPAIVNVSNAVVAHAEAAFWLSSVPCVLAVASGTAVGTGGTGTPLSFGAAGFDTDTMYDATNHRVKATRAGKYRITAQIDYAGSALGTLRYSRIFVNGTSDVAHMTDTEPAGTFGGIGIFHNFSAVQQLAAGDWIDVRAYQDAVASMTVVGVVWMEYIGA